VHLGVDTGHEGGDIADVRRHSQFDGGGRITGVGDGDLDLAVGYGGGRLHTEGGRGGNERERGNGEA